MKKPWPTALANISIILCIFFAQAIAVLQFRLAFFVISPHGGMCGLPWSETVLFYLPVIVVYLIAEITQIGAFLGHFLQRRLWEFGQSLPEAQQSDSWQPCYVC